MVKVLKIEVKLFSATWIQAIKSGPVVNFNRWQDWNGKTLRGISWYKSEEEQEYDGKNFWKIFENFYLVTFYAYADEGMIMGADGSVKQKFVCVKPLSC